MITAFLTATFISKNQSLLTITAFAETIREINGFARRMQEHQRPQRAELEGDEQQPPSSGQVSESEGCDGEPSSADEDVQGEFGGHEGEAGGVYEVFPFVGFVRGCAGG